MRGPRRAGSERAKHGVFINCPFDRTYKKLFESMVFTVYASGFVPRCALEIDDGAEVRYSKICRIVEECDYGIHDICFARLDPHTHLPRFNMPLELGLFLGCKSFGGNMHSRKACLILDRSSYRYRKFISDISGQDIHSHENRVSRLITVVRDWLRSHSRRTDIPGGRTIFERYTAFQKALTKICRRMGIPRRELTFVDFSAIVRSWLKVNRVRMVK